MRKHCMTLIWLCLLIGKQLVQADEEKPTDTHRIQRRFMWQQMDNSVMGGIMGRMFNGARVVKSMFSDLLPHGKGSNGLPELLPTETTRVKYIIRNPHTNKPMKVIKMRGTQKVVKLKMPNSKPAAAIGQPSYDTRMRQLEKEQELIAEGKLPMTSDEAIMDKYFHQKPRGSNEIVSGKIMEYQSWKPVYQPGEQPNTAYITMRPQALTQLHTDIAVGNQPHELLPKPEKLVSPDDSFENDDVLVNELAKQLHHNYEVTEHTGEESGEIAVAAMESGFVPSKGVYRSNAPIQRTRSRPNNNSNSSSTTSTTESPNYPAPFLKKYREQAANANGGKQHGKRPKQTTKEFIYINSDGEDVNVPSNGNSSSFAMTSLRARLLEQQRKEKQQQQLQQHHHHHHHQQQQQQQQQRLPSEDEMDAAMIDTMEGGDKWPAEVQHSYVTVGPSAVAFSGPLPHEKSHYRLPKPEYKRQRGNIRQRGSVKFGDKPNYDEI